MKRFLRLFLYLLIFVILLIGVFLAILTIQDYSPEAETFIYRSNDKSASIHYDQSYSVMTWNIGYAGLGEDMDFFYDGGSGVRTDPSAFERNLDNILGFMKGADTVDFFFVQEADIDARRSFYVNEFDLIQENLNYANFIFAKNYDAPYVPVPPSSPMGKVVSGLMCMSKYKPFESVRYSYPDNYSWPKHLFLLDRCYLLNRYSLPNQKELLLINTHNSAYDDGSLRQAQFNILLEVMLSEYKKGNYVIAGGDWNMNPPGFDESMISSADVTMTVRPLLDEESIPKDWIVAYDPEVPTNRDLSLPYVKGTTATTIIEYFICSPNIEVIRVKALNLGFENSDHNPVWMEFTFH